MQKRKQKSVVHAALIAAMVLPLFLILASPGESNMTGSVLTLKEEVLMNRVELRKQRREYWRALEEFEMRLRTGTEGLILPDINDEDSIDALLNAEPVEEEEHASAPHASSLSVKDLSVSDRKTLRAYQRARSCPESMKIYLTGFYELCRALTKDASTSPNAGLVPNKSELRGGVKAKLAPTLNLRLQMIEEAHDRSNRRTDTAKPMRPTPYVP